MKPYGEAALNQKIAQVRKEERNKHICLLSIETIRALLQQPCAYCGAEPIPWNYRNLYNGATWVNGIDRVDNTKGYEYGNSVPCCWLCNRMKNNMPLGEFIKHLEKIIGRKYNKKNLPRYNWMCIRRVIGKLQTQKEKS